MKISFEGIGENCITLRRSGEMKVGDLCSINGNGEACKASAAFCGVVRGVETDTACVQISGYAEAVCDDVTKVAYGYGALSIGTSGVAAAESGKQVLVVYKNAATKVVGFFL